MTTQIQNRPVGYGQLLRQNQDFRWLWSGQIVSLLGDWFNLIASAALVAELTQSGFAVGGLFVVRMLASFLVMPVAGVVADRFDRRKILIMVDILRGVTVLGFLLVRRPQDVWLLYSLTAVQLAISGFFYPTRNAILPNLVSAAEVGAANAIMSATWSTMLALGAALGGLVAGIWGNRPAFIIDSLTFFVSAVFIYQITYRDKPAPESQDKTVGTALHQYLDGLRYLRRHLDILIITLHKGTNAILISTGFQVLQVVIAREFFAIGEGGGISLGLMYAMAGVGTGLGPIIGRYFVGDRERPLRHAITAGYIMSLVGILVISRLSSFPLVLLGTFLRGFGGGIVWVFSTQLLFQFVPNKIRGRIFATEFAIFTLMSAIGAAIVGGAIDSPIGISGVMGWMAGLILIPIILWSAWLMLGNKSP